MWEFDRRPDTIVLEHLASTTSRTPISLMVAAIVLSALLPPSANATARFRAFVVGAKLVAAGRTAQLHGTEACFHPEGLPSVLLCPRFRGCSSRPRPLRGAILGLLLSVGIVWKLPLWFASKSAAGACCCSFHLLVQQCGQGTLLLALLVDGSPAWHCKVGRGSRALYWGWAPTNHTSPGYYCWYRS
jgi:hypothetical protein